MSFLSDVVVTVVACASRVTLAHDDIGDTEFVYTGSGTGWDRVKGTAAAVL